MSTVLDHATSEVHKAEMARLRAHRAKASGRSAVLTSTIGRSLSTLDHDTRSRMERKFDLCFVMAKQSIDILVAKYSALEERRAVDVGHAYRTPSSAKSFTGFIARSQRQGFFNSHSCRSHFFGLPIDGTTDAGDVEEELIAILYCAKDEASQKMIMTTNSRFLSLLYDQLLNVHIMCNCIMYGNQILNVRPDFANVRPKLKLF